MYRYAPYDVTLIVMYPSATVGVGRNDLVSGEAVALDLPAASLGLRILSGLIDVVVSVLILILLTWLSFRLAFGVDTALLYGLLALSSMVALVAIPTTLETVTHGKTLGHYALGLRTVRDDAGPIRFRHALTRALVGVVEIYMMFGVPALVCAAGSRRGKRVGDLVAGTYVIRDRFTLVLTDPVPMPTALESWARTADIASLPDHLGLLLRQFGQRAPGLRPESRDALAVRLTFAVAPFVAPAPPPDAPRSDVLFAIAAERRRRDAQRLDHEDRLRDRLLR